MSSATDIERILLDLDPQLVLEAEHVLNSSVAGSESRGQPPVRAHQMMGLLRVATAAAETSKPADVLKYADHQRNKLNPESDRDGPMLAFWSAFRKVFQDLQASAKRDMADHGREDITQLHIAMTLAVTRHLVAHNRYLGATTAGRR
jgi:hypothetical protein